MRKLRFPFYVAIVCISISSVFFSCKKDDCVPQTITDTITVNQFDVTDGLVAFYTFNNGSISDASGYNNHIVQNNAMQTSDRNGQANNAYKFDGSSSFMRVATSTSLTPHNITLYGIFKIDGFYAGSCHGNSIMMKGPVDDSPGSYILRFGDNNAAGCSGPPDINNEYPMAGIANAGLGADTVKLTTGVWYQLAYTYDGFKAKLYVNGKLKKEMNVSVPYTSNTNDLYIGKTQNVTFPYFFNGVIDEIRIYNRALSAGAIEQLSSQ
jgi:hypothetical protein